MRRTVFVTATVLILLTAGVAAAFLAGIGPLANTTSADGPDGAFPTQTTVLSDSGGGDGNDIGGNDAGSNDSDGDGDNGGGDATKTRSRLPFGVVVVGIEERGQTCRGVMSTVTNQQDTDSSGVTLYSHISVGNDTDLDDEVQRGAQVVGDLAAGESYTTTKRIEPSYSEVFTVQQADDWITVQTTIETDNRTLTYTEQRDVAQSERPRRGTER